MKKLIVKTVVNVVVMRGVAKLTNWAVDKISEKLTEDKKPKASVNGRFVDE